MRIFAISDLHTDFEANRLLLEQLSATKYVADALLVAGDIADDLKTIEDSLALLCSRFGQVFYTPGNHDLWVRRDDCDSIEKLFRVLELCERLGVKTEPSGSVRFGSCRCSPGTALILTRTLPPLTPNSMAGLISTFAGGPPPSRRPRNISSR
jgi:hypothetical protein